MKNKRLQVIVGAMLVGIAPVSCLHKDAGIIPAVSFSKDIIPVFTANCALNSGCHSGYPNSGDNVNLDSSAAYATIVNKQLVNTGNPTASLIYVEVSNGIMPKAPYGHLSATEINALLNWIKQGAKNN